jgi:GntR family transcriptional regulator
VELAINPNTVVRAFQQLQADGVLESIRGRGLAVREGATELCKELRRELITERLRAALSEALSGGLEAASIQAIVSQQLNELEKSVSVVGSDGARPPDLTSQSSASPAVSPD